MISSINFGFIRVRSGNRSHIDLQLIAHHSLSRSSPNSREKQLNALMRMYEEQEAEMCKALASDMRKSKQESMVNEIDFLKNDLRNTLMHLREWAAPEEVSQ